MGDKAGVGSVSLSELLVFMRHVRVRAHDIQEK